MLHSIQFSGITRMSWEFRNPLPEDPDESLDDDTWQQQYDEVNREIEKRYQEAEDQFNRAIEAEMDRRQGGNPDHPVSAFRSGWSGRVLVVDGPDLSRFLVDVLQEQQKFLQEAVKRIKNDPADPAAGTRDVIAALPPIKRFNWAQVTDHGIREHCRSEARNIVLDRYEKQADHTIEVLV